MKAAVLLVLSGYLFLYAFGWATTRAYKLGRADAHLFCGGVGG